MLLDAVPTLEPARKPEELKDPSALEPYSRAFHDKLLTAHPEWRPLCRMIATDAGNALYVEVPAPSAAVEKLWISTEDVRLTIGLGLDYHCRFDTYEPQTDESDFDRAIQFVDAVVQENLVLTVPIREVRGPSWVQLSDGPLEMPTSTRTSALQYDRLRTYS